MDADERLRAGDLDGARSALVEAVRARPADASARLFLFSLLALLGEWAKARTQLTTLARLSPEAGMLATVYGQAIDAEGERAAVFAGTAAPVLHILPPGSDGPDAAPHWATGLAQAMAFEAAGRIDEAVAAREAALDAAPDTPGELNAGAPDAATFDWVSDADVRFGPCFEAIIAGRYGWQPFDAVSSVTAEGPRDLRDLVWYPAQIAFRDGRSVAALLPARYPGDAADPAERLGRATGWQDGPAGQAGTGQHLLALSGGEDCGLLSVRSLTFR